MRELEDPKACLFEDCCKFELSTIKIPIQDHLCAMNLRDLVAHKILDAAPHELFKLVFESVRYTFSWERN